MTEQQDVFNLENQRAVNGITVSGLGPLWRPPQPRPPNECAGWLGYYARRWLPVEFDLVDVDGASPVVWCYWKAQTQTLRMIEEKPHGQTVHGSQERLLRVLVRTGIEVYVIYDADRLGVPEFPIRITRLGPYIGGDLSDSATREQFDRWLLKGLRPPL